jgi:hypothetical protein
MSRISWQVRTAIILICVSAILYAVHFIVFQNIHFLSEYTLFYFAFLPIEAIFVTLILDQLMELRARKERLGKLNMVIGAFFSEVGTRLLSEFSRSDPDIEKIRGDLLVGPKWTDERFVKTTKQLKNYGHHIDIKSIDLEKLRSFIISKRNFLLRILENPVLLEHESFTELLRAVFHLTEELELRKDLKTLPDSDLAHLESDMERAYARLIDAWLDYMKYMKERYPYLFSLAMRTNPFDVNATPIVN